MSQNANITLALTNIEEQSINITLPYAAFVLTAQYPLVNTSTRYFPLKRAANESQYTLGRTFVQETYIIADYERRSVSVSQSKHGTSNTEQKLIPIIKPRRSRQAERKQDDIAKLHSSNRRFSRETPKNFMTPELEGLHTKGNLGGIHESAAAPKYEPATPFSDGIPEVTGCGEYELESPCIEVDSVPRQELENPRSEMLNLIARIEEGFPISYPPER